MSSPRAEKAVTDPVGKQQGRTAKKTAPASANSALRRPGQPLGLVTPSQANVDASITAGGGASGHSLRSKKTPASLEEDDDIVVPPSESAATEAAVTGSGKDKCKAAKRRVSNMDASKAASIGASGRRTHSNKTPASLEENDDIVVPPLESEATETAVNGSGKDKL